jgi:hypothetical protein
MLHTEFKNNTSYCRRIGLWESLGCFRKDNYLLDNAREERGRRVLTVVFFSPGRRRKDPNVPKGEL